MLFAGITAGFAEETPGLTIEPCADFGPSFVKVSNFSTCVALGLDLTAEAGGDLARNDLSIETGRNGEGSPAATYGVDSRGTDKHHARGSLLLRPNITAVTPTGYGPLWIHLRPSSTSVVDQVNPDSAGPVLIDDVWASIGSFTVGHRFSFFDYNPGFNYKPGYASYRTTNLFAFTWPLSDTLSTTLSVEDGYYRRRGDGVWASYRKDHVPDFVGAIHLEQGWGNAHAAIAVHRVARDEALGCTCSDEVDELGFAASTGIEYRRKFGEMHGRIMFSAAAAEGALDYLGIPRFAPDYIATEQGLIKKTKGFSAVVSYEHVWRPDFRTAVSLSAYGTSTSADDFHWHAKGYLAQFTVEYMPMPKIIIGAELDHFFDVVRADEDSLGRRSERAAMERLLLYFRRLF
jgi:Porin subfamily